MYERLSALSLRVVSTARECAIRSDTGLTGSDHLLYGVSAVGLSSTGAGLIPNALLVSAGLNKHAIEAIVGKADGDIASVDVKFSTSAKRVLKHASKFADEQSSREVQPQHILHGLFIEAMIIRNSEVGQLIAQISPRLDLGQMLESIDDLLDATDRDARIAELDERIAKATLYLKVLKSVRSTHRYIQSHTRP
jgi:ATP-dependent Clp protease ATP-binding subunit ClpA